MPSELGDLQLGSLLMIVICPLEVIDEDPDVWTPVVEVDEPVEDDDEDVVDEEDDPVTLLEDVDDPLPAFPVALALLPTIHWVPLKI